MHLGISSYTFPWHVGVAGYLPKNPLTAFQLLDKAAELEIPFVQYGDNLPLHLLGGPELSRLKNLADAVGIGLEVGTRGLTRENLEGYVAIAAELHSPFLRVVIDDGSFRPEVAEVMSAIEQALPMLKAAGVILAIENHDRFPAKVLAEVIESTDPAQVGICLDTANSLGAGEGIREVVAGLAPYTVNLHIKDFTISRVSHKMGFEVKGCAAGDGLLDIPWLLAEIERHKRCNTATLELWSSPLPSVDATLRNEEALAAKSLEYLKPYFIKINELA